MSVVNMIFYVDAVACAAQESPAPPEPDAATENPEGAPETTPAPAESEQPAAEPTDTPAPDPFLVTEDEQQ